MGTAIELNQLKSTKDRFTLSGKKAIVTGAAGGIGRSCAAAIAELGADVALIDLKGDVAQQNAEYIADKFGVKALAYGVDISDVTAVNDMMGNIIKEFGRVDCVHSNAGIFDGDDNTDMPIELWRKMVDINLTGMYIVNKAACIHMRDTKNGGAIVNTASMSGSIVNRVPGRHNIGYPATKAGVKHLTKALAMDFRNDNIRVNSVSPGYMFSGIHDGLPQDLLDTVAADVPMNRFGTMDEIGGAVAFLMTDLASYITGADIIIDGGYTVW